VSNAKTSLTLLKNDNGTGVGYRYKGTETTSTAICIELRTLILIFLNVLLRDLENLSTRWFSWEAVQVRSVCPLSATELR